MKKNYSYFNVFLGILFLVTVAGCTEGSGMPVFQDAQRQGTPPSGEINDDLARQAGLERLTYNVGPVDLPAHTEAQTMRDEPMVMRFEVDKPTWVIGFEPKVVDARGAPLPAELLHEAILFNMHEENPLCRSGSSGNPFAIASSTLTEVRLPDGFGYPILPSDPIEARAVLKNTSDQNYIDVFYKITLVTKPMNEFVTLHDVKPILLDFDPCEHRPLSIPPGSFEEETETHPIATAGSVILANGLIQDYGVAIALTKRGAQVPFWRSTAVLDESHRILSLEDNPFEDPAGVHVSAGDAITIGATYNNFSQTWLHSASAAALIYLAVDQP